MHQNFHICLSNLEQFSFNLKFHPVIQHCIEQFFFCVDEMTETKSFFKSSGKPSSVELATVIIKPKVNRIQVELENLVFSVENLVLIVLTIYA